jgi:hypothetical protein
LRLCRMRLPPEETNVEKAAAEEADDFADLPF